MLPVQHGRIIRGKGKSAFGDSILRPYESIRHTVISGSCSELSLQPRYPQQQVQQHLLRHKPKQCYRQVECKLRQSQAVQQEYRQGRYTGEESKCRQFELGHRK